MQFNWLVYFKYYIKLSDNLIKTINKIIIY